MSRLLTAGPSSDLNNIKIYVNIWKTEAEGYFNIKFPPLRYEMDNRVIIEDKEKNAIDEIKRRENKTDHYEDLIGTYLVKLSAQKINENTVKMLPRLIEDGRVQLLFGTGERNYEAINFLIF